MVREDTYAPLQASETLDTDLEDVGGGSTEYDRGAVSTRVGATKYAKLLAMLVLLVGAVGVYSVANSSPGGMWAQPTDKGYDEAGNDRFYEIAGDEDTTAPPESTAPPQTGKVVGQLGLLVSSPDTFATDPAALQAVKETIAAIAGVPVSAVKDVKMVSASGTDPVTGKVWVDFAIDVPADKANEVADRISSSTPEANSAILSEKIADAGLSATYPETKVTEAEACVEGGEATTTPPVNPCVTTLAPTVAPVNPCATTLAPTENPCATTLAPANPCATTQAPTAFGKLKGIFR